MAVLRLSRALRYPSHSALQFAAGKVIEAVAVVGDLLRPDGKGRPGGVDRPTLWLFDAIKRQIALAAGVPVEPLTTASMRELRGCLEALRPPQVADTHWASVYAGLAVSDPLSVLLSERLRCRFCVGYELPPWLVRLMDDNRVPYLDLRLHPVRFMDDLMFAARASCHDTQVELFSFAMNETEVIATAGLREAMCRFISEAKVPDDTLLVVGQRPFDSSQIVDGRFFDAEPLASEIHAICGRHRAVILKPHPHDKEHSLLAVAADAPAHVLGVITDNLYRIIALPQVSTVLTVNSSVAHEAPYFGKRVHTLAPLPVQVGWQETAPEPHLYASLDDVVLTPDFWRMVLTPYVSVSKLDGMRLRPKPNRLRIAFDSFWNFQEIDTDRIPRRSGG
jgi:hypothetical protein